MKAFSTSRVIFTIFVLWGVFVVGMCWQVGFASANLSGAHCHEERRIVVDKCKPVIYGRRPSAACCHRVRVTHIECVCPVIAFKLASFVDVKRGKRLIEGCGRRLPRHLKCGSITIP